jgi:hypothetical protein
MRSQSNQFAKCRLAFRRLQHRSIPCDGGLVAAPKGVAIVPRIAKVWQMQVLDANSLQKHREALL